MNPIVIEYRDVYLPIRQMAYNEENGYSIYTGSIDEGRHVRPVTDAVLNSQNNFPSGSLVISNDPINQEIVHVYEPLEDELSDSDASINSNESGSAETVRGKRMLNKRILRRLNIISEKLKYFQRDINVDLDDLILSNLHSRIWNDQASDLLEKVATME